MARLFTAKKTYARCLSNFRGVDFSSDHTLVDNSRFAYSVNMFRDYMSGQGQAVETIPGFRLLASLDGEIYGIHHARLKTEKLFIHAGEKLYAVYESEDVEGLPIYYTEKYTNTVVSAHKSISFTVNNTFYLIDGENFLYYNEDENIFSSVTTKAYVPTTYKDIYADPEKTFKDFEYEQVNLLATRVINTFAADGTEIIFYPYQGTSVLEVKVDGEVIDYDETLNPEQKKLVYYYEKNEDGLITVQFNDPPKDGAVVEIELEYVPEFKGCDGTVVKGSEAILGCTIACEFDGRIFLTGNPKLPCHLFWCSLNSGYPAPSYWGELNYVTDGISNSPITGLIPVADSLLVLKGETEQDGAVYYHYGKDTGENLIPRIYPAERGLNGIGCLGACVNFLDDPVFVSRLGLEAIGNLSVKYERTLEHRSSLIDAELAKLNLSEAQLTEWNGYLVLLIRGKIFLADSRQRYTDSNGIMQYEWYYLEDIGVYNGQDREYRFASKIPSYLADVKTVTYQGAEYELTLADNIYNPYLEIFENHCGRVADYEEFKKFKITKDDTEYTFYYVIHEEYALLVEEMDYYIGGEFSPACTVKTIGENLLFGTERGEVCIFNFDKRNPTTGKIPEEYYDFNGRIIECGVATKMDNCNIPHQIKTTASRSVVLKVKMLDNYAAKIKVRTDKQPYTQVDRIGKPFTLTDADFSEFSFVNRDETLFAINEREKRWMEKQYFIYSDEFRRPFALLYIAYSYSVEGRYKE